MQTNALLAGFLRNRYQAVRWSGFVLAYCILAAVTIALMQPDRIGTPVWPAAGVGVAAVLLLGKRAWLVPFIGGVFTALYRDVAVGYALLVGVGVAANALLCVWLLHRWLKFDSRFLHLMDIWGLAGAAILSSALCSNIDLLIYVFAGKLPSMQYAEAWGHWWRGDALGILIVTPLVLAWADRPSADVRQPLRARIMLYGVVLIAAVGAFYYPYGMFRSLEEESMLLVFPPLAWAVLRFPLRDVATSLVLVGMAAIAAFPLKHGNVTGPFMLDHQLAFFLWLVSLLVLSLYVLTAQNRRMVAELRDSHEQLNALLETLPDGIGLKDGDGCWRVANRAALDFFSLHGKGWQGKTSRELASTVPEIRTAFETGAGNDDDVFLGGRVYTYEEHIACPDGVTRDFEVRKFPRFDADGARAGMVVIGRDITEETRLRSKIAEQERKYHSMLQTTGEGFWLVDMQGRLLEANPAYARLSGYSVEELTEMCIGDLDARESPEETARHIRDIMQAGNDIFETRHRRKDGSVWEVEVHASYLPENEGYFVAFMHDISDRKAAEQVLRESHEQLTTLIETLPDAFFLKDGAGRWLVVNQTGLALFRLQGKAWKGKTDLELAVDFPELGEAFDSCVKSDEAAFQNNGQLYLTEERVLGEDGNWRDFEVRKLPRFASDGTRAGLVVIGRDITEQNANRRALENSDARLREQVQVLQTVLDALPAEVALLGKDGCLVTVNRNWEQHCEGHCDLLSIAGQHGSPLKICVQKLGLATAAGKKIENGILSVLHGKQPQFICEYPLDYPKRKRWFKLIVVPIASSAGQDGAVIMNMDMTQAKNAEEVIRWREQQYRAMTENSPDMIARVDTVGSIFYANRAMAAYFQCDAQQVLGRNIVDFCPTDMARDQWHVAVEKIVRNHKSRVDIVFEFAGQEETKVFQAYVLPESGKDGNLLVSLLVVIRDVTELRRSEFRLRESRSLLRKLAAENEAIREKERKDIARELHDELGQLLNALRMDIGLIRMQYGHLAPDMVSKTDRMLDVMDRAITSMRTVVVHLRPNVLDMGLLPALEWLRDDFTKIFGIECRLDVHGNIPDMEDEQVTAIFRIAQESLTNAAKHAQANYVRIGILRDGGGVRLVVQDDGCGFDPYVASAEQTHFGLLGMRERARALGGNLEVLSAQGKGCSVILNVPVRERTVELLPQTW